MITIHSLSEENIKAASQSLSRAFMNDPLQKYVFPDADERSQKSPAHFEAILRYGYLFGEVYTTQNMEGAVVCFHPVIQILHPTKQKRED
jgi:hypothetical protein